MTVAVATMSGRRRGIFEVALKALNLLAVAADNLLDVGNLVKVDFELVDLGHDGVEARNLGVGVVNDVAGVVVLLEGDDLGLLAEQIDTGLDLEHEAVEVAGEGGEAGRVEQQAALGRGAAGGARGARVCCGLGLVVAQQRDLVFGEAQLRVWDGGYVRGRHSLIMEGAGRFGLGGIGD